MQVDYRKLWIRLIEKGIKNKTDLIPLAGISTNILAKLSKGEFSENDGFLEISPVTVICGNQATGKSTIAKLYSTCAWLENKVDSGESSKTI